MALQENARREAAVELERTLDELNGHREIQELEVQTCRYRAQRDRQLFELGVFSEDQARTSESEAARAAIALRQIEASIANAREAQAVRLQSLDLEIGLLQREREEVARRLRLASPASDRAGVVTWVVPSEGSAVRKGASAQEMAETIGVAIQMGGGPASIYAAHAWNAFQEFSETAATSPPA